MGFVVRRCRELYNAALEERREAWQKCGVSVTVASQSAQLAGSQRGAARIPRHPLAGLAGRADATGQSLPARSSAASRTVRRRAIRASRAAKRYN